jgi:hypothetical protein
MNKILIKLVFYLCCFSMLNGQENRFAFSARISGTSMMMVVLPMSYGLTIGPNFEYRISNSGFLGLSHSFGYSVGDKLSTFRMQDSELYYYFNNHRLNIINQAGLRFTFYEDLTRKHYLTYGDRVHAMGIFIGNNRIFIDDLPRIIFGIQYSITVSQMLERYIRYTVPTSFLFFSLRYMISSDNRTYSRRKGS